MTLSTRDASPWMRLPAVPGDATAAILLALTAAVAPSASAQSTWTHPEHPPVAWVETARPTLAGSSFGPGGLTSTSMALFAGTRLPVSGKVSLVGELPVAFAEPAAGPTPDDLARTAVGNPYLGVEFTPFQSFIRYELGVRLPVAPANNFAAGIGLLADPVDRMEAFASDLVPFTVGGSYRGAAASGFVWRLRADATTWIPTNEGSEEFVLGYGGQAGYRTGGARLLAGISGRTLVSDEEASLGDRSLHVARGTLAFSLGRFEPGLHAYLPLDDDLRDLQDFGWGVSLAVRSRR